MKRFIFMLWTVTWSIISLPQGFTLGWEGGKILPDTVLLNAASWIYNQSNLSGGDSSYITSDSALNLHWVFGAGARSKFAQCYINLLTPVNLDTKDLIGIDIHGKTGKRWVRNVELKFESGSQQASYTWENLAHINRWCERVVVLKKQFSNYQLIKWDSITVISLAVNMNSQDETDIENDSGIISIRNLIAQSVDAFIRADTLEKLSGFGMNELEAIRLNAANAIKNRQNPNGLLTTWLQDGSSWLYGQGLALRVLTEEGEWNGGAAVNGFAQAAENLARFMAEHQREEGYWPRAWNASSGDAIVELEGDNTIWMGDFPWIPGSLAYYYRKSGDADVLPAILKAKSFLYDLVEPNGKVNTLNIVTRQHSEVSNYEGYAATLYCLLELGDTIKAKTVMDFVMSSGWDIRFKYWNEGPGSSRPVLLVNTWLAALAASLGYENKSVEALSLVGKLLYTRGPGEPYGFDGVGPIATWYEGTLSYIASGGPGSNALFTGIKNHINTDGTMPAYNENLGGMAGIWAVDWSSLDATSWLYFAAAQKVPFGYSGTDPDIFSAIPENSYNPETLTISYFNDKIYIYDNQSFNSGYLNLSLYSLNGTLLGSCNLTAGDKEISISDITSTEPVKGNLYLMVLTKDDHIFTEKFVYNGIKGK
jgi:hypothetical protein